jgi:hypothetical protein
MQILTSLQALVALVAFEHVKGHQDTKYSDEPLSRAAQLNQRCDEIATAQSESATTRRPASLQFSSSRRAELASLLGAIQLPTTCQPSSVHSPACLAFETTTITTMSGWNRPSST